MKVKDLSEEKEKIIQLWKADEKVLALILARSIMTDKHVLEFCIENEDINITLKEQTYRLDNLKSSILRLEVGCNDNDTWSYYDTTFIIWNPDWWNIEHPGCKVSYKNERSKIAAFNKFLNHICGNKRIKK